MSAVTAIERSFDAAAINAIVNHPEVLPWVAAPGQTELDLTPLVDDPRNIVLMAGQGHGGFVLVQLEPGVYEVHTQFLPEHRGPRLIKRAREAAHWMFCRTDCMELLTKCPVDHPGTATLASKVGFTCEFKRPEAWRRVGSPDVGVQVDFYALRYPEWIRTAKADEALSHRGVWFHDRLQAEKRRLGRDDPGHDDDFHHDVRVGAAVEMILGGQIDKGLILYNRWARFAGYAPIDLISRDPLVIDIHDPMARLLHIHDETFEVI